MTYKTKDGQEIKVGGVYLDDNDSKFKCFGFKSDGQQFPVFGLMYTHTGKEVTQNYQPEWLTSLPESQPEYDPDQMCVAWFVNYVNGEDIGGFRIGDFRHPEAKIVKEYYKLVHGLFAIAPVGKRFRKGDNL